MTVDPWRPDTRDKVRVEVEIQRNIHDTPLLTTADFHRLFGDAGGDVENVTMREMEDILRDLDSTDHLDSVAGMADAVSSSVWCVGVDAHVADTVLGAISDRHREGSDFIQTEDVYQQLQQERGLSDVPSMGTINKIMSKLVGWGLLEPTNRVSEWKIVNMKQ